MKPEDRAKLLNDLRNELLKLQTQRERGTLDNPGRLGRLGGPLQDINDNE
ncbi:50S ribosomal protein L29 [Vulcanisaeta sp. JCM 16161]|nr:50S ribosomal protein L29 [Vulcanisaeta sp. JCM 16161]